jgi:hypothetical protein
MMPVLEKRTRVRYNRSMKLCAGQILKIDRNEVHIEPLDDERFFPGETLSFRNDGYRLEQDQDLDFAMDDDLQVSFIQNEYFSATPKALIPQVENPKPSRQRHGGKVGQLKDHDALGLILQAFALLKQNANYLAFAVMAFWIGFLAIYPTANHAIYPTANQWLFNTMIASTIAGYLLYAAQSKGGYVSPMWKLWSNILGGAIGAVTAIITMRMRWQDELPVLVIGNIPTFLFWSWVL